MEDVIAPEKVVKQKSILTSGWFCLPSVTCNNVAIGVW